MSTYKYLTWMDKDEYYHGNELLSVEQIQSLMPTVNQKPNEVFATVQDYDKDGNIIGCNLFIDIDNDSLLDGYNSMQEVVQCLMADYEVEPAIYFSGRKGYHILAPLYIRHPRCHEIAKMIVSEFTDDADPQVYRTRSMFRCANSWHNKGFRYKIPIDCSWNLVEILDKATRKSTAMPRWITNWKPVDIDISSYIEKLPDLSKIETTKPGDGFFTPCIAKIWNKEFLEPGQRHKILYLMVRQFYSYGMTETEAARMFDDHPFWKTVKRRDYEKVIRSVYNKGSAMLGCKNGADADIMKAHCELVCPFNDDFKLKIKDSHE